jgi:hypothetical protein
MLSIYHKVRNNSFFNWFTINLRFIIGFGFLPSGLKKIVGQPFANPGQEGAFMEYLDALFATGFYYEMIGWAQVIAAVLLISQRFATIGAILFLPIIFNIMVLTLSTIGSFTPVIATLMFFGISYLVLWDYYKWINIFSSDNNLIPIPSKNNFPKATPFWVKTGILTLIIPTLIALSYKLFFKNEDNYEDIGIVILLPFICIPIISNLIYFIKKLTKQKAE